MVKNDSYADVSAVLADQTGTRKAVNRRLVNARKEADKNAIAVKSRIKMLEKEDNNILKKIDQTRRMADKIQRN